MRPIFIVGSGRSGTNLLGKALGECLGAHNFYEQRYVWSGVSPLTERCHMYSSRRIRSIRNHMNKYRNREQDFIDKTPGNLFRIRQVTSVYPDAKFIFLVRNPIDNIASRKRLINTVQPRFQSARRLSAHFLTLIARNNIPIARFHLFLIDQFLLIILRLFLRNPYLGRMERVDGMTKSFIAAGSTGIFINQLVESEKEYRVWKDRVQIILVRYEDLQSDTLEQAERIGSFLSLSCDEISSLESQLRSQMRPKPKSTDSKSEAGIDKLPMEYSRQLVEYMKRLSYEPPVT